MHRILIIGGVVPAAKKLWKQINDIEPEVSLLEINDNLENAVQWLSQNNPPDLIFADLQLPVSLGLGILNRTDTPSPVVFITPHDPYVIGLFKKHGIHFIQKPVKKTDLLTILSKLKSGSLVSQKNQIGQAHQLYKPVRTVFKKRFVIKKGATTATVSADDIAYLLTNEKNNFLVISGANKFEIDYNLDALETMLDPTLFFRINRQFIIAKKAIADTAPHSKSRLKLFLDPPHDQEAIVSAARVAEFKNWVKSKKL